ncbi:hypothetical protein QO058_30440 (plasmid) [Bosea vestrisii]|uniref:SctD/MshK family protein n=1 Tax=Bosea vestrisii TaxID=151416 RepID=UPI0024E01B91|nr:hypothetical protein [Bosea vestrisii]WID99713.1 hypothetical protein QO058_30440 [Bosea vestrisii]
MSETASFKFEVQSGHYAGLSETMSAGVRVIGSSLDADLVFVEQGLEPQHLRVTLEPGRIAIEALAPGVLLDSVGEIAPGETVESHFPALVQVGTMSMRWADESAPLPAPANTAHLASATTVAAALIAFVAIAGTMTFIYGATADARAPTTSAANVSEAASTRKFASARPDGGGSTAAAQSLQAEVEKAGLLNIRIGSGPGVVAAEGTIEPGLVPEWQKLQQWFDRRYTGALTLVNGVAVKEEKLPSSIAVEAVWQGTQPHLLVRGQKYFVGAMLDDGWTIHRIESDRVLLSRDGRLAAVRY